MGPELEQEILRNYFEHLLLVLRQHGPGLADHALARVGLERRQLPTAALSFDALYAMLDWLHTAQVIPVPGVQLGLRARTADFSVYGQALRSARCSGESLHLAQRFFGSAWRHVRMDVFRDRDCVVSRFVMQPSAVCHAVPLAQAVMAMCAAVVQELVPGCDPAGMELRFAFPRPADAAELRRRLRCPVRFGQPWHELQQPAEWLDRPLEQAAPEPRAALQALGAWQQWQRHGTRAEQVERVLLDDCDGAFPSQAEVARRLGLAERTLRLQLAAEGRSFRALMTGVRMRLAQHYLAHTELSVDEVAAVVGYGHAASFHRAWRQHHGLAPRASARKGAS